MQINYPARICEDKGKIEAFLKTARTGVLGLDGGEFPYAVPVNFIHLNDGIYFHGMGSGKKFELLSGNPAVSFTVFQEQGTVKDPVACHADTAYFSVMIFGRGELVRDPAEAAQALQALVEKYMPGFYRSSISPQLMESYRSSRDNRPTALYRIQIRHLTAKQNWAAPEELF
jgi:nitroimidazol reductase NimA-like FMN-containing flavoprotein (pyridoxamine 5'-phosphate oxidase superfamily)